MMSKAFLAYFSLKAKNQFVKFKKFKQEKKDY